MSDVIKREAAVAAVNELAGPADKRDAATISIVNEVWEDLHNIPAAPVDALVKAAVAWAKAKAHLARCGYSAPYYDAQRHADADFAERQARTILLTEAVALAALDGGGR